MSTSPTLKGRGLKTSWCIIDAEEKNTSTCNWYETRGRGYEQNINEINVASHVDTSWVGDPPTKFVNVVLILFMHDMELQKSISFCFLWSLFFDFQMCLSAGVGLGGSGSRRKLSFKNVSNVVVQLLHSIKFNVDVPFSNMAASPQELKANAARKVRNNSSQSDTVTFYKLGTISSTIFFAWEKFLHQSDRFLYQST